MKFECQVGGLLSVVKPMYVVASKGVMKESNTANFITFKVDKQLNIIADGGYVSGSLLINDANNNLSYLCNTVGEFTVNAGDLLGVLNSFNSNDMIVVELSKSNEGAEVVFRSTQDADEMQSLPVLNNSCSFVKNSNKKELKNSITINRSQFISYANKITFAHGDQIQFNQFKYWILRSFNNNSLRFVAGTGQMFAVVDLEGKSISSCNAECSFMFPNDQTATILSVLSESKNETVIIESYENCILIDADSIKLRISNIDPSVKWPDENKFLQRKSKINFTTKVGSWKNAVKGINATNNNDFRKQNKVHQCSLEIDIARKIIQAKTVDSVLKSQRKVAIDDVGTDEAMSEISVRCVSAYFNDILGKASDEENLQFELTDSSSPIVVRYYADSVVGDYRNFKKETDSGVNERYAVFFAVCK
jgi:hypothetical protein